MYHSFLGLRVKKKRRRTSASGSVSASPFPQSCAAERSPAILPPAPTAATRAACNKGSGFRGLGEGFGFRVLGYGSWVLEVVFWVLT